MLMIEHSPYLGGLLLGRLFSCAYFFERQQLVLLASATAKRAEKC